tara:strand:- start:256267 stop:256788 length:522 start_codon:yes stop_codon:yes gene_type:complete
MSNSTEYKDFLESETHSPSAELSNTILHKVRQDLNPTHTVVFSKLLGTQLFIGVLTLLFCPQFNLSLTNNYDLFHYFHHTFGEKICMAICGFIFIGSGAVFASYLLKSNEITKIKESRFLYYFSITTIALSTFLILGAQTYLYLSLYWFMGASFGGLITFEINRIIRRTLLQY